MVVNGRCRVYVENMLIYDGTYMLERKEDPGASPAHACSWLVKIINFAAGDAGYPHIRPYAIVASRQEGGIFKTSCAESLGKRICGDFDLKAEDLLWIESFPDLPGEYYVAVFSPRYHEMQTHYNISWRPILPNERDAVANWL
jgi:hypothetical protein